ncbi:MAG: xanthine phosphoribosyltransferase [Sporolactobacillus sp.]
MEELKARIVAEGKVLGDSILKVDRFLNHQIDPGLMKRIGQEFANSFAKLRVSKIITIESSGIAPAVMTGLALDVPVIFIRKKKPSTAQGKVYTADVYSYTKKETNMIYIEEELLTPNDRVLIIDDFLANGEAALGLAHLVKQSGAHIVGIGVVIEKAFQQGHQLLENAGYQVRALASITSLTNGHIQFIE